MVVRMPETCWAVFKWQVINLRSCCISLVDSVESMMMHGLAKSTFIKVGTNVGTNPGILIFRTSRMSSCQNNALSLCVLKNEFSITFEKASWTYLSVDQQKCPELLPPTLLTIHECFQTAHWHAWQGRRGTGSTDEIFIVTPTTDCKYRIIAQATRRIEQPYCTFKNRLHGLGLLWEMWRSEVQTSPTYGRNFVCGQDGLSVKVTFHLV
jgi:hypothetical protein